MKGSHEIKKLYGSAGRGYRGAGRICPKTMDGVIFLKKKK